MKRILLAAASVFVLVAAHAKDSWAACGVAPIGSTNDMVVSFLAANGTQAAPAAALASSQQEGMLIYDSTTDSLKLCDGTNWVSLQFAGGGTAAGSVAGAVQFRSAGGTFAADDTNLVWDDTNNRLGIGTATPAMPLDISAGFQNVGMIGVGRLTNGGTIAFRRGSDGLSHGNVGTSTATSNDLGITTGSSTANVFLNAAGASGYINMITTGSERLRISNTGNIGIGTISPQSLLHVANTGYAQFERDSGGPPTGTDCDNALEFGRVVIDATNDRFYVCEGAAGWKYTAIGASGAGGAAGTAGYVQVSDGAGNHTTSGTTAGQQFFWNNTTKRLGIGTTTPSTNLEVSSPSSNAVRIDGSGMSVELWRQGQSSWKFQHLSNGLGIQNAWGNATYRNVISMGDGTGLTLVPSISVVYNPAGDGTNIGSFIGINTASATRDLSLGGTVARTIWMERHTTANTAGNSLTLQAGGATSAATDKNGGNLIVSSGTATGTGSSSILFQTATAQGSTNTTDNAPTTKMTILGNGNVGIGTTTPAFGFHHSSAGWTIGGFEGARGTTNVPVYSLSFRNSTNDLARISALTGSSNTAHGQLVFNTTGIDGSLVERARIDSAGNVGIGTATPSRALHIANPSSMRISNIAGTEFIEYMQRTTNYWGWYTNSGYYPLSWNLSTNDIILVDGAGRVGVGATSPQSLLHVGNTGYAQFARDSAGAPTGTDCDNALEFGRVVIDGTNDRFYVCEGAAGWKYTALGTSGGGGSSAGPAGYVQIADGLGGFTNSGTTGLQQFFWNNTTKRLGIGTATPSSALTVANYDPADGYSIRFGSVFTAVPSTTSNAGMTTDLSLSTGAADSRDYSATISAFGALGSNNHTGQLVAANAVADYTGTGTISNLSGNSVLLRKYTGAGGTISNLYGYRVQNLVNTTGSIGNTFGMFVGDITTGTQTNTPFSFYASDVNAFNYFAGNVGIGTTSPSVALEISNASPIIRLTDSAGPISATINGGSGHLNVQTASNARDFVVNAGSGNPVFTVKGGGSVGIGTTNPQSLLQVANTGYAQFTRDSAGAPTGTDCDNALEFGRVVIDGTNDRFYVCEGAAGWKYTELGASGGSFTAGTDKQIIFNDGGTLAGNASLLFDKAIGGIGVGIAPTTAFPFYFFKGQNAPTVLRVQNNNAGSAAYARMQLSSDTAGFLMDVYSSTAAGNWGGVPYANRAFIGGGTGLAGIMFSAHDPSAYMTWHVGSNAERMRLDANGNLGIGTATPTSLLHLNNPGATALGGRTELRISTPYSTNNSSFIQHVNSANNGGNLNFGTTASGAAYGAITFQNDNNVQFGGAGGDVFFVKTNGRVSIGTTLPDASAALQVDSTTRGILLPRLTTAQVTAVATPADGLIVYDVDTDTLKVRANGAWASLSAGGGGTPGGANTQVQFNSSGAFAGDASFLWDNSGKYLEVTDTDWSGYLGSSYNAISGSGAASSLVFMRGRGTRASPTPPQANDILGLIAFRSYAETGGAEIRGFASETQSTGVRGGYMTFLTTPNGTAFPLERMRIDNAGNIGVGVTTIPANTKMHIRDDNITTNEARVIVQSTDQRLILGARWQSGVEQYSFLNSTNDAGTGATDFRIKTGNTDRFTITSTGNVGIGTTTPDQGKVEVKGGTVCVDTDSNDNATSCIASESDARLKTNVVTLATSLDTFMKLRPVSYDWKVNDPEVLKNYPLISRFKDRPHTIGLIAQEVQEIVPEAIESEMVGDGDTKYFQLDYTKLVPVIIKAVQDLKNLFDGHDADIQSLKAENAALRDELKAIRATIESLKQHEATP